MSGKKPTPKPPTRIEIAPHKGVTSPHLLDLRALQAQRANTDTDAQNLPQTSFEERVAAFDERLKEMPNLLKARAYEFSKWRKSWSFNLNAAIARAQRFGIQAQKKFNAVKVGKKVPLVRRTRRRWQSGLPDFAFIVILVVVVTIPLQAFLLHKSIANAKGTTLDNLARASDSIDALRAATQNRDVNQLHASLNDLAHTLSLLRKQFDNLGPLKILLPGSADQTYLMLQVGEQATLALTQLSGELLKSQAAGELGSFLQILHQEIVRVRAQLNTLSSSKSSPLIQNLNSQLGTLEDAGLVAANLFGSAVPRRILLIFQNPRELRATGGFAGSFALLTVRNGKIESVTSPEGGTYAVQGQLPLARISPKPLHLINPRFEFQDINWWPDFPTSAEKITEFYEATGEGTIDAVVALTASVGAELLRLHGSIETNEGIVDTTNFIDKLQETVARDRIADRAAPKKVISELFPKMTEVTINVAKSKPKELFSTLQTLVQSKDIQLWTRDEKTQAAVARLGLSGALTISKQDYLAVITANVGGGKTDGAVTESLDHRVKVSATAQESNLRAHTTLTITRSHSGVKNDPFTGHHNRAYIRVYVPSTARFISALGNDPPPTLIQEEAGAHLTPDPEVRKAEAQMIISAGSYTEIWKENDKTVFGVWLETSPGESKTITLEYETTLPQNGELLPYSIVFDPQGGKPAQLNSQIEFENPLYAISTTNSDWKSPQQWQYQGQLNKTILASGVLIPL